MLRLFVRPLASLLLMLAAWSALAQNPFAVQNVAYVEVRGQVRDGRTGQPIAGVHVLAIWEATSYSMGGSTRHCLRIAGAESGVDGRFSMAAPRSDVWQRGLAQQYVEIRIQKAGWGERDSDDDDGGRELKADDDKRFALSALLEGGSVIERHLTENVSLFPSTQDASDRLQTLKHLSDVRIDCETEGERNGISGYYNSIANEAHQIAKTHYERALADVLTVRSQSMAPLRQSHSSIGLDSSEWSIMAKAYAGPDPTDLERRDQHDKTPLMNAAEAGNASQVSELLSRGANPNRTRRENDLLAGDSALTLAMQRYARSTGPGARPATGDYLGVIATLLHHPMTNPNLRDRRVDYTPLMKALERGQDEIVALLLEAGADPNLTAYQKQFSPLRIATARAMTGQSSAGIPLPGAMHQFHLLLAAKGIDLNMTTRYDGQTALTAALGLAKTSIVRDLLTAGADPNAPDSGKRTPLIVITQDAILNPTHPEHLETFKLMAGWPGVHRDTAVDGKTALQLCQESGRADLVAILAGT